MRTFISGANGQLGRSLVETMKVSDPVFLGTRDILDITNRDQVLSQVAQFAPECIFHFASVTRGEENAKDPESARKVNVTGTKYMVEAAKVVNAKLIFVSTNEVFDGRKSSPYTEQDTPHPITTVGQMKLEAEEIIRSEIKHHFIIRTMWLYSNWSNNFIHTMLRLAKQKKKVQIVSDEIGSPTSSLDLAIALQKLVATDSFGTFHLVNSGEASRLEFAKKAFEICNIQNVEIQPIALAAFNRLARPPHYSVLDTTKAKRLGITMRSWEKALEAFLQENNFTTQQ